MAEISGLDKLGLGNLSNIKRNLPVQRLVEDVILRNEGRMGPNGAVMVDTGEFTGRSPKDKYFVDEDSSNKVLWWGDVNQKISEEIFNELQAEVVSHYNNSSSENYIFDGYAGADKTNQISVRIIAKKAWQSFFCHNMFIRPENNDLQQFHPDFTIINASDYYNDNFEKHGMNSKTFIIFNLEKKLAIIGGTEYGGEMKKGIFSLLHYILPQKGVLSMHCSANVDKAYKNTALFFGLSGTGKTTLSTDSKRPLVGDDEHGWSKDGIFNFEGGCYAKVIKLDKKEEPDIFEAIRHGALLENVVFNENTMEVDFDDNSKTDNTRVSYPLKHIKNSLDGNGRNSVADHPKNIIFLTCDAYGVLPPVSKLTSGQAMYHFISGYTAKVAGTERGITEPKAVFSPCFGGPFLTLHPLKYAQLLREKIKEHNSDVYLVNTGWVGGSALNGATRIKIGATRRIIDQILNGEINNSIFKKDPFFNLSYPEKIRDVDAKILNPRSSWLNKEEYDKEALNLSKMFIENFKKFGDEVVSLSEFGPSRIMEKI